MILHEQTLPFELTNKNAGRKTHWAPAYAERRVFERTIRKLGWEREPFSELVTVTVTRILGPRQRLWDSSSIGRGNYKELEDALVACGWFVDDGPNYIDQTIFKQDDSQRHNGPAVKITIEKA